MRINHNIAALNTYRQLTSNTTSTSKSLEKLSSGLRVNRAGDDAAGLAISEKMRGQIRGLTQASRNAQDGISLIQTAEGALNETHAILQRMRELAVQAASDTNVGVDRGELQKEISQLNSEIDRISNSTEFNTQKLLNGSLGAKGQSADDTIVKVDSATGLKVGTYNVTVNTAATQATKTSGGDASDANVVTAVGAGALVINGITIDTTGVTTVAGLQSAVNAMSDSTGVKMTGGANGSAPCVLTANEYGSSGKIVLAGSDAAWTANGVFGGAATVAGVDAIVTVTNADAVSQQITGTGRTIVYGSAELTAAGAANDTTTFDVTTAGATIHIGANSNQSMLIDVNEMSTNTLGNNTDKIKDVSVLTQANADKAIKTVNDALEKVSSERSKLGAFQNRLEHTINNLDTSAENLQASEARIRDVDMAKEMMEFTKNNILSQAAQAMLAQANMQPQSVLQLLQ
ncbi:MAG: flagellin [Anaerovoracaceae bacterium]|jgi:flagellin